MAERQTPAAEEAAPAKPPRLSAGFYEEHQAWPADVADRVARHLLSRAPEPPGRCLFLGTATGVNDSLPFARLCGPGCRIIASDIEPAYLSEVQRHLDREKLAHASTRRVDITEDLAGLCTFDLVTLFFVIHRLKRWEEAVPRLAGLLNAGGSFYISEFVGPSGVIYLSNEGGADGGPVSRMIRRYFELLGEPFEAPLKSTRIAPVLERLKGSLAPRGYRDFAWPQVLSVEDMLRKIEERVYAPYFSTRASGMLFDALRREFAPFWTEQEKLVETIRIYRFDRA